MRRQWIPSPRLITVFTVIGFFIFMDVFIFYFLRSRVEEINMMGDHHPWSYLHISLLLLGLFVAFVDYFYSRLILPITIEREIAGNLAVDKWAKVVLKITHGFKKPTKINLSEGIPTQVVLDHTRLDISLEPQKITRCEYQLKPLERGQLTLNKTHVQVNSPWRLWQIRYWAGEKTDVKVYPDFMAIANYVLLATENHISQLGIKKKQKRGEGLEFHQLREYRGGDSLHQLDWKATARRQKLISREYQDERDQQIVLLVDSGRRMRAKDDELSHFDHALNALLLVSYIALRQGDTVSLMSFGNDHRWIPPQKGTERIKVLLNGIYDLQAGTATADYLQAAEKLWLLQPKRALIILVTHSRDEDNKELLMAVNLLKQRHLVMVANIREQLLDQVLEKSVQDFDGALTYLGAYHYLQESKESSRKLGAAGIHSLNINASELAVTLANSYLEIKSARIL
jgi:uncharacterized protein (DUF58 family)